MKRIGRPYPKDVNRILKVKTELIKRGLSIFELSKKTGVNYKCLSDVISGRRISPTAEERVAQYFGKQREELFPRRTIREIEAARAKEKKRKKAVA